MHHGYKSTNRDAKSARETRTTSTVELRNQKRNEMLQKKRTMAISRGPSLYSISELAEKVTSDDADKIVDAVTEFRRLLSATKVPPIDSIVENGLTPVFSKLIDANNPFFATIPKEKVKRIMHESAWVVTNIASGNSYQTEALIKCGCVTNLIKLMHIDDLELQDQAVWALGNISGDGEEARDLVIRGGVTEPLLGLIGMAMNNRETFLGFLKNLIWALSNTNRGRNPPAPFEHMQMSLPAVVTLIRTESNPDILADAFWALSYICDAGVPQANLVLETGIIVDTVRILASYQELVSKEETEFITRREKTISPIMRTLGNIITYEDHHTDYILSLGVIDILKHIYSVPFDSKKSLRIKKEICWVISNITAGTPAQIDEVIKAGFLEILVNAVNNADQATKVEACWAICNATIHANEHIHQAREVLRAGTIPAFAKVLPMIRNDTKVTAVILDCITNLLECGRTESMGAENQVATDIENTTLLDQVEELQTAENVKIASKAENIIRVYFDCH
ncbi:hypothetical protein NEHOM01_1181 [Nematocida homosporus]|uniref:uncharacterized protein n=1 Tax=Nematocida homosporus TaxID=1912981 RepID=UPI00221F45B7|nr:uncharacterized protein NEHOM01_1181 [Nematocida homosporus]KAI5185958.1 hypothetical protein NEHOM01_1181 [Nematocida homosporus]